MQKQVTQIVKHIAASQQEMAQILEAERHMTVRMSRMVHDVPAQDPSFEGIEALMEHSMNVTKNIAAYLSSLADLEDALAEHMAVLTKLIEIPEDEE